MIRLLHLSDTHFGTERPEVMAALVPLAAALSPTLILWTGDITQRATDEQFRRALSFAHALPQAPLLVMPGNHDLPLFDLFERALAPYRRFARTFGSPLEPSYDAEGVQLTTVDTTRRWRQQRGAVSRRQIERVAQRLARARRDSWRLVATHHPLMVDRAADRADRPWRHQAALQAWGAAGAEVLLAGHTHVPFAARAEVAGRPWVVQAGSALSTRLRHGCPNAINLLAQRSDGHRFSARWDYDDRRGRFVEGPRVSLVA